MHRASNLYPPKRTNHATAMNWIFAECEHICLFKAIIMNKVERCQLSGCIGPWRQPFAVFATLHQNSVATWIGTSGLFLSTSWKHQQPIYFYVSLRKWNKIDSTKIPMMEHIFIICSKYKLFFMHWNSISLNCR